MNPRIIAAKILLLGVFLLPAAHASASMVDLDILDKKDIVKLTDDKLIDTYIDVLVELEASRAFHATSGFTPKAYTEFKDILRYRIQLLMEIHKRGLEAPAVDK